MIICKLRIFFDTMKYGLTHAIRRGFTTVSIAYQLFANIRNWSLLKRVLLIIAVCVFAASSFLFLTPPGENIRLFLAKTVITTQHRDWAWIFVGAQKRDVLVTEMQSITEINAEERQNLS